MIKETHFEDNILNFMLIHYKNQYQTFKAGTTADINV